MSGLQLPTWTEPSALFDLIPNTPEAGNQASNADSSLLSIPNDDTKPTGSRKMAIPRLAEGAESAFTSPGRFHRRHVRRACESCRQRKTKCTGDKSGCRNCREAGIICCYTDGKREKSKRQLASLSAKVQAYEDVIKKLSNRFGVSDEQLMSIALMAEVPPELGLLADGGSISAGDIRLPLTIGGEPPPSRSSSVGPFERVDHIEEDFNRDETARATGFIGKSSEITWLQKLSKEVDHDLEARPSSMATVDNHGLPTPLLTPKNEVQRRPQVASSNYYLDDLEIPSLEKIDINALPPRETATQLLNAYLSSVHPSFPIIGISTFVPQFHTFFKGSSTTKPNNKWFAILNLIFAIGAKYFQLTGADWKGNEDDHGVFFSRARALSLDNQVFQHPDLQQLQVEGLASFYLLACGHINRPWKLTGSAVRGALALGLHLRSVDICTPDISKELRYRVWWSLYAIEYLLSVVTGRPSCIIDNTCTTPLPVPFDESEFQKEEVARLISDTSRSSGQREKITVNSSALTSVDSSSNDDPEASTKEGEVSKVDYLKSLPPCMSLYFLQLITLTSISKRTTGKLYSPEAVRSPWASTEFTIQSLMLELDSWFMNLPGPYDFTSTQVSQCPTNQRMSLAFLFYSTKIGITRPCLCRLDSTRQDDREYEFCSKTAADCVEAACHMLTLLPDTSDAELLNKISPWWCILHFLMQATTVLLLELAFRGQHMQDNKNMVSKAAKKSLEWLSTISKSNMASERAWKLCDGLMSRLSPHVGEGIGDFAFDEEPAGENSPRIQFDSATAANTEAADVLAADLDSIICSPLGQSSTPIVAPVSYGLNPSDSLDITKPEKSVAVCSTFEEALPYDPLTGQITGSFFPDGTTLDLEDMGYMFGETLC